MKKNLLLLAGVGLAAGAAAYFIRKYNSAASEANEEMTSHDLVRKGEKRLRSAMHRAKVNSVNPAAS